ncbi:Aste57867_3977 [Aphanomyces stellatus]|uniref:histone acetyltransferase n=1 Tax=Aphanomyces stellatus TaxID=120398 RepID=A0A485KF49_9STRA|nr:hypothetical protein As57867_003966 [Aphanomyces stellatus]VFT81114.1 Aste57867_3977 [Aphanomyces stellatus]
MKRPRPCFDEGSPSDVECDWEMGKLSVVPPFECRPPSQLSPLDSASAPQLRQHLQDLRREQMSVPMLGLVTRLMLHRINQAFFNTPVDVVRLKCPTYFDIVKNPMDLGTIKQELVALTYSSAEDVAHDIRLVFQNAMLFNPQGHVVHEAAVILLKEFEREYVIYQRKQTDQATKRSAHSCPHCQSHVCGLCLEKCINFEPPLVMCVGKCGQRLRRHAAYFTTVDRQLNWCAQCVPKLKAVVVNGRTVTKYDLVKAKFQDELTEPWVQCDACMGWVHQICALFNSKIEDEDVPYTCPLCRLDHLEKDEPVVPLSPPVLQSIELDAAKRKHDDMSTHSPVVKKQRKLHHFPKDDHSNTTSHLGSFMQKWISDHLIALGEPEAAGSVIVKLASSVRVTVPINAHVQEHFFSATTTPSCSDEPCASTPASSYPTHVTYTSKTILVFQQIHGIEVCLFSMYVQEYDDKCGVDANRKRTYIAYLDSLGYFRPRHARSSVYQQLVIAYLAFCKVRGFTHAHIWACPTTRGGDFIYWCHPTYQRNPNKDRLLQWYQSIIAKAGRQDVAFGHDTLFSAHFESPSRPLPPYFEGDYWVAEADRIARIPARKTRRKKTDPIPEPTAPATPRAKKTHEVIRAEVAASVNSAKDSLFVIPLQPTCGSCAAVLVNVAFMRTPGGRVLCDSCHSNEATPAATELDALSMPMRVDVPPFVKPDAAHHHGTMDDDVGEISSPFLNHRADLLKHCEEMHYQFDTFRRAKYSTMMLLHHLRVDRDH